jgi:glycosyltransferase involved in cell wall biosynthesis
MTDRNGTDDAEPTTKPSLLMVATIAPTIRGFLTPYATHFRTLGWRVEAAASGATADPELHASFDAVHDIPLSRSILDLGGMWRSLRAIGRIVAAGYDIVHVHTPIAAFVTRAAIRRLPRARRPAVVYTAHGFHFYRGGNRATNALFLTAERVAGRWTDRLIVINDEDRAAALGHRIVPGSRLVLMPGIGVDTAWYAPAATPADAVAGVRAELGIDPATPLFALVGELSMRKRPFDAVAALGRMDRTDSHLVVVGEGTELPRVEAAIRDAGVVDRVHLVGWSTDVRPIIAASDALLLASRQEGLPRCVMEALSLEVPVIATDARGSPDLVEPDAGFIVPIGDVDGMAKAMDRILADPDAARDMGRTGRARMVERYDLGFLVAEHERLYRDVLAERTSRR